MYLVYGGQQQCNAGKIDELLANGCAPARQDYRGAQAELVETCLSAQ